MRGKEGGTRKRSEPNPFATNRSSSQKQAVVYAAEQTLKPWEVRPSKPGAGGKPVSQKKRYEAALAAPVNAPIQVGKKRLPARELLADTMTPERKRQHRQTYQPPVAAPKPDTSFLHALLSTPRSVAHNLAGGGKITGDVAASLARDAAPFIPSLRTGGYGGHRQASFEEQKEATKRIVGPALYNAVTQGQTSHLGAAGLEAAALFPGFRPLKIARDATRATRGGREVKVAAEAVTSAPPAPHVLATKKGPDGTYLANLDEAANLMPKGDYLYHVTNQEHLNSLRRTGILPGKTRAGEPTGVYLAEDGFSVYGLLPRGPRTGVIALRVKRGSVPTKVTDMYEPGSGFEEHVAEKAIPAHSIEYAGADGQWHPLVEPLTAEGAGKQIVKGMSQATRLRREQEQLRTVERGIRTKEAALRMDEIPGEEGHHAALAALKGPLPTLRWDRFEHFDKEAVDAMIDHIRVHPALQGPDKTYTRINTEGALLSIVSGNLPRKFEQKLLRDVFGDATDDLLASVPFWKKVSAAGLNLIGVPRTLLASFDLSAPLRQGLLFGISHPVMWGKNFGPMVKAFGSPRVYEDVMQEITARPTFDLMEKAGLPFTDIGAGMAHREEQFMSSYAERIPGVGRVVKASNRAYVAFLNKSRADYFDWLLEQAQKLRPDIDIESPEGEKMLKSFARVAGTATGRGTVKNDTIAKALPALNQLFFAPRLLKSRIDVIANPAYYATLDPVARREAFKHLAGLVGVIGGILTIAKLAGAKVNEDPRNADWAKIRVGNTRFDIAAGFQQPLRLIAQVGSGTIISSTTGKKLTLDSSGGYGKLTKLDILTRFGETKLAPPPSFVVDFFRGTDFEGKPFSWKKAAYQRLVPLLAQDTLDMYRQGNGIAPALGMYGIGMWGVGSQTYGPKPAKGGGRVSDNPFVPRSSRGSSSNPFASSSGGASSSSSNPFASR